MQPVPKVDLTNCDREPIHLPLEGSSLGARVIARDAHRLGLGDTHGARHLGTQMRALETWRGLLALMEDGDSFNVASAVAAANAVFDAARLAVLRVDNAARP